MTEAYLDATAAATAAETTSEAPLGRRLLAEFVGTLLFVAVGTGAATVLALGPAQTLGGLTDVIGPDPNQQRLFGALFGTSAADLLTVALAFATALAALIYAFGGVSGAHFNPAVTFALAVGRRFRWAEVLPYWLVQCLGGIGGAIIVAAIYGENGAEFNDVDIMYGATTIADNVTIFQAVAAEAFIGFLLMTAIMAVAVDPRAPKGWSGLIIGLALAGGILVTAAATGGSANFARSLGPFVASVLAPFRWAGVDVNIPWADLAVYFAAPLMGAAAAALVYESVTGLEAASPAPSPGAATGTHAEQTLTEAPDAPTDADRRDLPT